MRTGHGAVRSPHRPEVKIGDAVNWSKLASARVALLWLLGLMAISGGAFLIYIPAGLISLGVGLAFTAYLITPPDPAVRR